MTDTPCPGCGQVHSPESDRKQAERTLSILAVASVIAARNEVEEVCDPTVEQINRITLRAVEHFFLMHGAHIAHVLAMLGTAKVTTLLQEGKDPEAWVATQAGELRAEMQAKIEHIVSRSTDGSLN